MKLKNIARFLLVISLGGFGHCRNANSLAREGLKNLEQGKKITALKYFEEALDANKKNPIALYGKGKIMTESVLTIGLGQKMLESSLEKLDSEYKSDALLSLAKSYARTNLYDKAIKILESSISNDTKSPETYQDLSFYYIQNLDKVKGRSTLYRGIQAFPDSENLILSTANFEIKNNNNLMAAIDILENYKKLKNDNQDIIKKLAYLYYKTGNSTKAVELLNNIKKIQTDEAEKKLTDEWIGQVQTGKWQINL